MLDFEELRIRVRPVGRNRYLVLANGPTHGAAVVTVDGEPAALRAEFAELVDIEFGRRPRGDTNVVGRLRAVGRAVFELLFPDELVRCLDESKQVAAGYAKSSKQAHGLRLRFDLPAELHDLPIEALTSPAHLAEQSLALDYNLSLVRSLRGNPPAPRLPDAADLEERVELLVAVATPAAAGLAAIDADHEISLLRKGLPQFAITTTVLRGATRRRVQEWLGKTTGPAIVLLIAHGGYDEDRDQGLVLLETETGGPDAIPADVLSGMLVQAQQLRLVVLNLCAGAVNSRLEPFSGVAQALIGRGIPAVVGMRADVSDHAANTFGPRVLEAIAANKTVDEAVTAARHHISSLPGHTSIEWATPTLFLHEVSGHGWLFKAKQVREEGQPADDPLSAGEAALERYHAPGPVSLAGILAAARFLRARHDWQGVLNTVTMPNPSAGQQAMITEARLELVWPAVERVCDALAGEHDAGAAERALAEAEALPGDLVEFLRGEIRALRELDALCATAAEAAHAGDWSAAHHHYEQVLRRRPHGFRDAADGLAAARAELALAEDYLGAQEHCAAGQWSDAVARYTSIVQRRPAGYRDAAALLGYARGRLAESQQDWPTAVAAYDDCADIADAPARRAYARGRVAAAAGQWADADSAFTEAARLGGDADEWHHYSAALVAEHREDWPLVAETLQRLTGFRDSDRRAAQARGRVAAQSGDWLTARTQLAAADADAAVLAEVDANLYRAAVAAERKGDWQLAGRCFAALPDDHADDVSARAAYAAARVAEQGGDWAEARRQYESTDHADAATRLAYSCGRLAEDADDWATAHEHYSAITAAKLLDTGTRVLFAAGVLADGRADWTGVIDGFDVLPDDYRDGAVGRVRRFARAMLAAQRADWPSVLAFVEGAPDAEREGRVGLLRRRARGKLAEQSGDWAQAVAVYTPAADADPELLLAKDYALARGHEQAGAFTAAYGQYCALPDEHADVSVRRRYTAARLAEQAAGADSALWGQVERSFAELNSDAPGAFPDAPDRETYARLRRLVIDEDWPAAVAAAEDLADAEHADVPALAAYAAGRIAEQDADWPAAVTAYASCGDYADAGARAAYARGRHREAEGQWRAAIDAYEACSQFAKRARKPGDAGEVRQGAGLLRTGLDAGQPDPLPDAAARRERLELLLVAVPWADGLAAATLVADPLALDEPTFPYRALRGVGITPGSSTKDVADTPFALMRRGSLSWSERVALDQLRSPAKRLLVDALLYQLRDPAALGAQLAAIDPAGDAEPLAQLCAQLPGDAALLTLLSGDRAKAIRSWRQHLVESPCDLAVVHCLATASYWQARQLEQTGAWEQAGRLWRTALECWAVLLIADDYWVDWRQTRARSYGHAVTPADTARLRAELSRHLTGLMAEFADRHAAAGRPEQAARYRELGPFLDAEMVAARELSAAGGLPVPGTEDRLCCGPSYLRTTGLASAFGRFVAEQDTSAADEQGGAVLRRLRWAFSEVSPALGMFEQHRFEQALAALPELHRQRLAALPADCATPVAAEHGELADCPHCNEFLVRNPAYTWLPGRRARLLQDAVNLAVRIHLSLARGLLTARDQLDLALAELTKAVEVAANATMTAGTRDAVLGMVVGRVDALADAGGPRRGERLDEAVMLAERAQPIVGGRGRDVLSMRLAKLLVDRGIWFGSGCRDFGLAPDIARGIADLRRALALNPQSPRACDNLARALVYNQEGDLRVLHEALGIVHEGLVRADLSNRLLACFELVLEEIESYLLSRLSLGDLGELIRSPNGNPGGVHALVRAARADPADTLVRADLLAAVTAMVDDESTEGAAEQ